MSDTISTISEPDVSSKPARSIPIERIGLAVGLVLLVLNAFLVFGFVHDDAFITYRYSWHLRHGFGAVFNPVNAQEPIPTEGYSCPLYMFLTALLMFLPGDVLFRAKLLGIVAAGIALWAAWKLAKELELPPWARAALPVLLGANSSLALSAVDGMETTFQMMLLTLVALAFVREQKTGKGWTSALWLLGAVMTRAEGPVLLLVALGPMAMRIRKEGMVRRNILWLASVFVPLCLFLLWRHWYYGEWVPNTYYAKNIPLETALDLGMGPAYMLRTFFVNLNSRYLLAGIALLAWLFVMAGAISDRVRQNGAVILPLFVVAQALVTLKVGGDWMQGWRYMTAVVPLWTLLLLIGLLEPAQSLAKSGREKIGAAIAAVGVLLIIVVCFVFAPEFRDPKEGTVSWARQGWATDAKGLLKGYRMENAVKTGEILSDLLPHGSLVAYSEVGATPYYSPRLRWLDTYGLTDREIAHLPSLSKFRTGMTGDYKDSSSDIGRHLLKRRPDYIIQWLLDTPQGIPILDGHYVPLVRVPLTSYDKPGALYLHVWERADRRGE